MLIHWPAKLVIDERFIIPIAILVAIAFLVISVYRNWRMVAHGSQRWAHVWGHAFWRASVPLTIALILAFAATLIWPKLGIAKDSFQTNIDGVPIQVNGQPGVFTVVYLGALYLLSKVLPGEREPATPKLPPVRTTRAKPFPPASHEDSS